MHAVVWSDYLCPWCYLGLRRTALLVDLGVDVTCLPYELHPELPIGGITRRRGRALYERIAAECAAAGMPFRPPDHIPNTRLTLEAAELVRRHQPAAFGALHRSLFDAYFADGADIGAADTVFSLVRAAGAHAAEVRRGLERGEGALAVDESMAAAAEADVTGTPAWLVNGSLLIPGVQSEEFFRRVVGRIRARTPGGA